jgi:phosphatidylglycerol:prolipoprotein diacylglycerol transferase
MPFLAITFPVFDPVAIALGPIVIRWYALAYIGGIVLGWVYARALIKSERLWGGPSPISLLDFDDFILWVTLGIILGGRTGYVLFYNLDFFVAHPAEILELWKGGMSFHGGFMGCVVAVMAFCWKRGLPVLSLGDLTCAVGPIGLLLGRLANFINSELWGRAADDSVPWAMVFPNGGPLPRHPSQLYEAGLEGIVLFYNLPFFIDHPLAVFELWKGGMSFHGGFMGCVIAVIWFSRRNGLPILSLGDITTAVAPLGLLLGRIANFINGELWGRAADPSLPWAMIFPNDRTHLPRHPSQLYEAGLEGIVLFAILALMIRAGALKRPGLILGSFIFFYALARIVGEFFREPDPQLGFLWGGLTMGMLLSLPMIVAGLVLMITAWRRPPLRPELNLTRA